MTGEPTHTASKEIRVLELMFLSKHAPQLSIADWKVNGHYTSLSAMFSLAGTQHYKRRTIEELLQLIQSKNTDSCVPQLSITDS